MENHLHPLFDTSGEQDGRRIVVVIPPSVVSLPPTPTQWPHSSHFHIILRKTDKEINHLKVVILHNLGSAIPNRLWAQVCYEMIAERRVVALIHLARRIAPTPTQSIERAILEACIPVLLPVASLPPMRHKRHQGVDRVSLTLTPLHERLTRATSYPSLLSY